jgi:hypothetical protein
MTHPSLGVDTHRSGCACSACSIDSKRAVGSSVLRHAVGCACLACSGGAARRSYSTAAANGRRRHASCAAGGAPLNGRRDAGCACTSCSSTIVFAHGSTCSRACCVP